MLEKFRVLSDLHVDINRLYPLELKDKDVFTVVCGDTGGEIGLGIDWIRKNVRRGVIVSGNHMPYGNSVYVPRSEYRTMDEIRARLKEEFPIDSDVSYLDVETGDFVKEVDGVLFMGSCFYTDFRISEPTWNPTGDRDVNMACAEYNMNDYMYGYTERIAGAKPGTELKRMRASDCLKWFDNAFAAFDGALTDNEKSADPKPVVVVTHYPLVKDYLAHNSYLEKPRDMRSQKEFAWGSYASDLKRWLKSHPSVKAACSGHVHDVEPKYRYYSAKRKEGGDDLLLVHNVRGYVSRGHDRWFNPDTFVDAKTWKCWETPLSEEEEKTRKAKSEELLFRNAAWSI